MLQKGGSTVRFSEHILFCIFPSLHYYLFLFRNLFAIFYKTHPDVTEADFWEIYKGLDKEAVKVGFR